MLIRWIIGAFFLGMGGSNWGVYGFFCALGMILCLSIISDQIEGLKKNDD